MKQTGTEHGEENLQMKTHAYVHRRMDRSELKEFGGVCLFISPNFSKAGRRLFVHTH